MQGQGPQQKQLHPRSQFLAKGDVEQRGGVLKSTVRPMPLELKGENKRKYITYQEANVEILLCLHKTSFREIITSSKAKKYGLVEKYSLL